MLSTILETIIILDQWAPQDMTNDRKMLKTMD